MRAARLHSSLYTLRDPLGVRDSALWLRHSFLAGGHGPSLKALLRSYRRGTSSRANTCMIVDSRTFSSGSSWQLITSTSSLSSISRTRRSDFLAMSFLEDKFQNVNNSSYSCKLDDCGLQQEISVAARERYASEHYPRFWRPSRRLTYASSCPSVCKRRLRR